MKANDHRYDVVIVGAGITGSILANKLGQAGADVLLLDVGDTLFFDPKTGADHRQPLIDRMMASTSRVPNSAYANPTANGPDGAPASYAPMPYVDDPTGYYTGPSQQSGSKTIFGSSYTRIVGGTTYHWLGTCLRYVPSTFKEQTLFGRGTDWPISYLDLEEWYWKAENEIGVSGDDDDELGAPRFGRKYPMPRIYPSYSDQRLAARTKGLSYQGMPIKVQSTPQGRNSMPYQDRPPCAGSSNCVPLCPIQAKYDATVHLKRALNPALDPADRPGSRPVTLKTHAVVHRVEVDGEGKVASIVSRDPHTREDTRHHGTIYILATHGIETPKILLTPYDGMPEGGVANSSDAVGRYLMDHNIKIAYGVADEPLYPFRGPLSTSGVESLRDGSFRRERAAFRIEIENCGTNWATNSPFGDLRDALNPADGKPLIGNELRRQVAWDVNRQVQLDALIEPEPDPESTVRPSTTEFTDLGLPRPSLDHRIGDYTHKGAKAFEKVATMMLKAMGSTDDDIHFVDDYKGAGHVMGTHRMGDDPRTSVTDSYGRTHDHPNLWLTGSGLFPTVGSANPTLTIVALTLRTAEKLIDELGRG